MIKIIISEYESEWHVILEVDIGPKQNIRILVDILDNHEKAYELAQTFQDRVPTIWHE